MKRMTTGLLMLIAMVCLSGCALPPLHQAVINNDIGETKSLIAQRTALEVGDSWGRTPLMAAVFHNRIEHARVLINAGANVNKIDNHGARVLDIAIANKRTESAKLLIEHGAEVNYRDNGLGYTPLGSAIMESNLELVRYLLAHGARLDYEPKFGGSYLRLASMGDGDKSLEIAQYLIDRGEKVNVGGSKDPTFTPLMAAAGLGRTEMVKLLISNGAQINLRGPDGKTAQELAEKWGKANTILAIEEAAAQRKILEQEKIKKAQEARIAAQPCPLRERGWFLLQGSCVQGVAEGPGRAETENRGVEFVGNIKEGRFVNGLFRQRIGDHWQLMYEGPVLNGNWHGNAVCGPEREACEWRNGNRIDAVYLARVQRQEADARERQAREELARLEERQREETKRIKAIQDCERKARQATDENTSASCDDEGNLDTYRHNRGNQARNVAMFNAFNKSMDDLQRQARSQTATSSSSYRPSNGGSTGAAVTSRSTDNTQLSRDIQEARRKLELAQQETRSQQTPSQRIEVQKNAPARQETPAPKEWGTPVPEAIAACWSNNQRTKWFCDGPLQETLVSESDITKVRDLSGCNPRDGEIHEISTSGQYRVFGCGRGLRSGERDMRKRRGVSGGSNMYRCLKQDMDAGKICRQLSDY